MGATRICMVLSAACLAGGCVTRATYDDLQRRFDATSGELAERRLQHDEREKAFVAQLDEESKRRLQLETSLEESRQLADGYSRQVAGLQAVIADKRQAIAALEHAVASGEQELAQVLVLVRRAALKGSLAKVSAALIELTQRKLAAERRVSEFSAASKGEFHPVKSNLDEAGRAANRRIAIVIVPDLSELPGYDELETLSADRETTA